MLPGHILNVDFSKAFDLVDGDFLLDLLRSRVLEIVGLVRSSVS